MLKSITVEERKKLWDEYGMRKLKEISVIKGFFKKVCDISSWNRKKTTVVLQFYTFSSLILAESSSSSYEHSLINFLNQGSPILLNSILQAKRRNQKCKRKLPIGIKKGEVRKAVKEMYKKRWDGHDDRLEFATEEERQYAF